jgi:putative SOS response-associated peptidase YedK
MPRGVPPGEPDRLGAPPWERQPGEACLILAHDPDTHEARPVAMSWGVGDLGRSPLPRLTVRLDALGKGPLGRARRALLPLSGYLARGPGRLRMEVRFPTDASLAVAALWEDVPDGTGFVVVTTDAVAELAPVGERMPLLLPAELWSLWLAGGTPCTAALARHAAPAPLAVRRAATAVPRPRSLPVGHQLEALAPGAELWFRRAGRVRRPAMGETAHAVG